MGLRPVRQPPDEQVTFMRNLCFVLCLFAFPASAAAQHSFSLPPIGGPLPSIGLRTHWQQTSPPPWERRQVPAWERNRIPPWEKGYVAPRPDPGDHQRRGDHQRPGDHQRSRHRGPQVVYVMQAYPYPFEMEPQIVIVERPVTRIVEVEVPAREAADRSSAATEGTGAAIRAERRPNAVHDPRVLRR